MRLILVNPIISATLLAVMLLIWAPASNAALQSVEDSYELSFEQVERWPLGDSAIVVARPCATCERISLSVTANTCYLVTAPGQKLEQCTENDRGTFAREHLLRNKSMVRDMRKTLVYIFFRPDDLSVTRIVLDMVTAGTDAED